MNHNSPTIFTVCDERFARGGAACIASLVAHSSRALDIVVLDGGLTDVTFSRLEESGKGARSIRRLKVDLSQFAGLPNMHGSHTTYARLLMDRLTDQAEVLWIDADTIVQSDVIPLLETEIGDNPIAAVLDPIVKSTSNDPYCHENTSEPGLPYFNAGVFKANLAQWRREGLSQKALATLATVRAKHLYHDQSVLNRLLKDRWFSVDRTWNTASFQADEGIDGASLDAAILHFLADRKPWRFERSRTPSAQRFYAILDHTPYRGWRPSRLRYLLRKVRLALNKQRRKFLP